MKITNVLILLMAIYYVFASDTDNEFVDGDDYEFDLDLTYFDFADDLYTDSKLNKIMWPITADDLTKYPSTINIDKHNISLDSWNSWDDYLRDQYIGYYNYPVDYYYLY